MSNTSNRANFLKKKKKKKKYFIIYNLVKEGLSYYFTDNKIYVSNFEKWKQISMLRRMDFSMPSTTNSLESCHEHLNDITPRRNTFFTPLYRIVYPLNKQNKEYQRKITHNYNYQIKRKKDEMKLI